MAARKALVVWGGWDGHTPRQSIDRFVPFLQAQGFEVAVRDTLDAYLDAGLMQDLSLIVPCWTCGKITGEQWKALNQAVWNGCGLAGWHGGMCDAFRENTEYQFMTGGQWVAHPGNCIDYDIHISNFDDPVVAGLKDFRLPQTEQYYLHTDPGNVVLATTTFDGAHHPNIRGVVMPAVWKKKWGQGRVFYAAWGHTFKDFDVPEARIIVERGLLWAAR